MPRLFVSHSARDQAAVDAFVDNVLRLGCDLAPNELFYSSSADMGVPVGMDLNAYVREQVSESDLVLAMITRRFLASPYCLAELGAAWSRAGRLFPLLGLKTAPGELDGVLRGVLVRRWDDATALDQLHDRVAELVGRRTTAATWGKYRDAWLKRTPVYLQMVEERTGEAVLSLTACSRQPDHMEVFWTDGSGRVFYRWFHEKPGWSSVGHWDEPSALHVAAVAPKKGDEVLFGVSIDGRVWMRTWGIGEKGWLKGEPEWLDGTDTVVGPLSAVSRAPWHIELSAWTRDGKQCHRWRHNNDWTGWTTQWERA